MAESDPTWREVFIKLVRLIEILASQVILLDQEVVATLNQLNPNLSELTTANHAIAESGSADTNL